MPQHAPDEAFDVVVGDGVRIDVPAVSGEPVQRVAGRRVEPRRSSRYWQDESWWRTPVDLSRFDGMTEPEIAATLLAEFRQLRTTFEAD